MCAYKLFVYLPFKFGDEQQPNSNININNNSYQNHRDSTVTITSFNITTKKAPTLSGGGGLATTTESGEFMRIGSHESFSRLVSMDATSLTDVASNSSKSFDQDPDTASLSLSVRNLHFIAGANSIDATNVGAGFSIDDINTLNNSDLHQQVGGGVDSSASSSSYALKSASAISATRLNAASLTSISTPPPSQPPPLVTQSSTSAGPFSANNINNSSDHFLFDFDGTGSLPHYQSDPLLRIRSNSDDSIEAELSQKMRYLYKDVVDFEALFTINEPAVEVDLATSDSMQRSDLDRMEAALHELANKCFVKVYTTYKLVNVNEDGQLTYYNEYLRTPIDREILGASGSGSGSGEASRPSAITFSLPTSLKSINKRKLSARMNKHKADLLLALNMINSAVYHYSLAYEAAKKEQDLLWAHAALEGLCVASYLHAAESANWHAASVQSLQTNNNNNNNYQRATSRREADVSSENSATTLSSSLERQSIFAAAFKSNLKKTFGGSGGGSSGGVGGGGGGGGGGNGASPKQPDVTQLVVDLDDMANKFTQIAQFYNKNEQTKFLAFESSLMVIRFLLERNQRDLAVNFMNYAIYISNLQIKEESKVTLFVWHTIASTVKSGS